MTQLLAQLLQATAGDL